ncbi:unnamed protein product [Gongylonema pulchrum]|uniref:Terpene_synth_C domain-containing protein n=1 Tax=Gongylonema pulchrum TaxID=637853 RepID=A0A183DWU5_9BILA|nr:unnamed protein product [Gongylonema pulchrum]
MMDAWAAQNEKFWTSCTGHVVSQVYCLFMLMDDLESGMQQLRTVRTTTYKKLVTEEVCSALNGDGALADRRSERIC